MAKFCDVSDETREMVDNIANETGLVHYMDIEPIGITKSKEIIKSKLFSAETKYVAKRSDAVAFNLYEAALDRLNPDQREMLIRDAFNHIAYDSEKDKITIGAPTITVTIAGRQKYGEKLLDAAEAAYYAMQQILEEEKEAKAAKKAKKSNKQK